MKALKTAAAAAGLALALAVSAAIAQAPPAPRIGKTMADSVAGVRPLLPKAREGAPNIVWILLDDVGFGAASAFGGPIPTPNFEALANAGLRYTNFHTAAICSPTRAALLTGRNHHRVHMGLFPHDVLSAEFPGYNGRMQPEDGTVAEYLRANGYSTYALGKWHLTPDAEAGPLGPYERWPLGKGFDHYFGFLGGAEDQYRPRLVEDNQSVKPDGRHLNAQLIDKAISYIDRQHTLAPERPFFLYLAPGAAHSPHQVDQPWLDKFKGRYDSGWDVVRAEIFARQKRMGIIPANAKLPPRNDRVPAWDSLSAEQKRVYTRFMEGYAAFLSYTDWEIGRLVEHLRAQNRLENTAIFLIIGDNGGSKEGGPVGTLTTELTPPRKDEAGQIQDLLNRIDDIGTARTYANYPMGWAQALNTPFRKWKSDADSEGGTRNPLIVSWPKAVQERGVRPQFGHVIDLLPTALDMAGEPPPSEVRGIRQTALQGVSLTYSFRSAAAPTQHREQYFQIIGNGAYVKDGWKASFSYRPDYVDLFNAYPPPKNPPNNAGKEVWELYDLNRDFNERVDLAARNPEKLRALQADFEKAARENNVYPMFNWTDAYNKVAALFGKPLAVAPDQSHNEKK